MKVKNLQIFSIVTCLLLVFFVSNITFSQWTLVGAVTGAGEFPGISVADENTVFIFGGLTGQPTVFRSTDGGENFTTLDTTGLGSFELTCGWAVDTNLIFAGNGGAVGAGGGNASFYKTTNSGTLWILIGSTGGTSGFFNGIVFSRITPMFGIAESDPPNGLGQPYYVSTTTDGGSTWTEMDPPPPGILGAWSCSNSIMVINNQFFGFGVFYGASRVYMTSDGGANWFIGNLGIAGNYVNGFAFSEDKMRGIAATPMALPTISRTSDGGVTWEALNTNTGITSPNWYSPCKWIPETDICYIGGESGSNGTIAKSIDGGLTWEAMNTSGVMGIAHMDFYTDGINIYGYAVNIYVMVLKLFDVVSVELTSTASPADFVLKQNYPNPFNPSTTITFGIPVKANVVLKVFNSLGEEVAQLVNEEKAAGSYEVEFSAKGGATTLPSGIYFYRLQANEFAQVKKMMLLK
jgi:photosystem II stability/assembly factor-like uncharacterized protein